MHNNLRRLPALAIPFDAAAARARFAVAEARESEMRVRLNDLLRIFGKGLEADAELERARKLDPHGALVNEALARRATEERKPEQAVAYYREAIAAGSIDPQAYLVSAIGWLDWANSRVSDSVGQGGESADTAVRQIRRALELDPGNGDAYQALGQAFLSAERISPENVAELTPGLGAAQVGSWVRCYRALLERRLGQLDDCRGDLQQVVADPLASESVVRFAREQLDRTEVARIAQEVNSLLDERRYDDALRCVDAAQRPELTRLAADRLRDVRTRIEEARELAEFRMVIRSQDPDERRSAAEAFLQRHPHSRFSESIRNLLVLTAPSRPE